MEKETPVRLPREYIGSRVIPLMPNALEKDIFIKMGFELPYRNEIHAYRAGDNDCAFSRKASYGTRYFFVSEKIGSDGLWIPARLSWNAKSETSQPTMQSPISQKPPPTNMCTHTCIRDVGS